MARRYSGSSRRFRTQKKRRGTNLVRTYVVVALVLAAVAYGISRLIPDSPGEGTISATDLRPVHGSAANVGGGDLLHLETGAVSGGAVRDEDAEGIQSPRQIPDNPKVLEVMRAAQSEYLQDPSRVVDLRERLNDMLMNMEMGPDQRDGIQHEMEKLSAKWLFGQKVYPGDSLCETYRVQYGDTLERIGKHHKVPFEILQTLNGITRPRALQAGKKIKVINGPFHVRIRRSTFTMDLYLQNTYVKSYQVGLGMPGHETPTGTWIVGEGEKLVRPQWTDPNGRTFSPSDPDYPLGSRWIGLQGIEGNAVGKTGFAIHGTEAAEEIGKNTSRGCIRLDDGNAIELYKMLLPGLSKVRVFD